MESLTFEERREFAKIITPDVVDEMSDEDLQSNIDSGYNLVNNHGDEIGPDNVKMVYYWLEIYEDERHRRSGKEA